MDLFDYKQTKIFRLIILFIFTTFIVNIIQFVSSSSSSSSSIFTTTTVEMPTLIIKTSTKLSNINECETNEQCKQFDIHKSCDQSIRKCYCGRYYYEDPFNKSCIEKYRRLPTYKKQERKYMNKYRTSQMRDDDNDLETIYQHGTNFRRDLIQYTILGCFFIGQIVLTCHYLIHKRMKILRQQIEMNKQQQQQQQQEPNGSTERTQSSSATDDVSVEVC
ncbi:hypothetical protein DERP_006739 [Dermatophagoides pteronyssinus]|uniref:Uncharacterized protein n=1 Tax=Dermatophagoides pteronyssinus TaxID=6956 RepID=A0ABQ8IRW2_DERPT|nr:hypothetical protein DERP_006739 [Dermatophagoides pteronyssinus]